MDVVRAEAAPEQDCPDPSAYHLLLRLISLVYNSTPASSTFYAGILFDLFHEDLLAGAKLPAPSPSAAQGEAAGFTSPPLTATDARTSARRKRLAGDGMNGSAPESKNVSELLEVPRHQALHLYANAFLLNGEYYSAIECVRKHVDDGPAVTAAEGSRPTKSSSSGGDKTNERSRPQNRLPCMDCANILARACEKLGRYEEGRSILIEAVDRNSAVGHGIGTATLPSPQPDPVLTLSALSAKSNVPDQGNVDRTPPSPARKFYGEALRRNRWSWEAWVGWCDHGSAFDAPEAFPLPTEPCALPTVPTEAGLLWAHGNSATSQSVPPRRKMSASGMIGSSPLRRQRSSSAGTESTAGSHANTTTNTNTASSPPVPSGASGVSSTTSPEERFDPYRDRRLSPLPTRATRASSPALSKMSLASSTLEKGKTPATREALWGEASGHFHPIASSTPMTGGSTDMLAGDAMHVPSIAQRLRPHLPPSSMVNFETPDQGGRRDLDGLGLPPVPKRSRKKGSTKLGPMGDDDVEMMMHEDSVVGRRNGMGRNATGRNFSGKNGAELMAGSREVDAMPARRSSRLNGSQQNDGSASERPGGLHADSIAEASTEDDQRVADIWLLKLIQRCGNAYREFKRYNIRDCIALLESLPVKLQEGAWCLSLLGRCYYELANYRLARETFDRLFEREPYRSRDTEWYSTVLWHLDDRAALSRLAQHLLSISRDLPAAWIAAGNGFALGGMSDDAIRCFKRASLLDPGFAYAYTLAAHEALEMEEFERAIGYYQMAIRTDVRHYNAWYGLGRLYQKMGKMRYAEYHYRRAVEINPSNVILLCCVGSVLERRGDVEAALALFDRALTIEPSNRMAKFRRIRALVGLKRNEIALTELEALGRVSNSEAAVQFLLGKLYVLNGRRTDAQIAFTNARDLNPKLDAAIKAVLESKDGDDDGDASMEGVFGEGSKRKKVDVDLSAI